jgi:hypothetical protein
MLHMLLNLLSRGLVFAPDDGAGDGGGQGSDGDNATDGGQGSQTNGADRGSADTDAGDGDANENPNLVDITAVDEQGRPLWVKGEELGKVHREAAKWRTRLKKLEAQLATLTADDDKTPGSDGEQGEQVGALTAQVQTLQLQNAVLAEAARQREDRAAFVDPAEAWALLDRSAISVDKNGTITGVQEAVAALATSKPHLLRREREPDKVTRTTNPPRQETLTLDDIKKMSTQDYLDRKEEVDKFMREHKAS